ncbi:MAG: N-acetylmuramoyl-L-alanine amidase, partial [bacterium]
SSDVFVLRVELNQKQQWGYYGRYVGKQFWLNIRKTPQISTAPGSPLRGLTITVDAGHGGEFEGAVGPTGLYEKDVNLQLAKTVAAMLEAAGAQVLMTRMSDTTVTLRDRIKIARSANSHIFVSLHNNSIGPATNPLRPRGTSTYHTVPQSEAVARSVYNRMLELGLSPFGRVLSTYFVTRQTSLISFLVESVFITHPEDELLLLDESFLQEMAGAVVNGIKDFVVDKMPADSKTDSMETDGSEPAEPDTLRYWRD